MKVLGTHDDYIYGAKEGEFIPDWPLGRTMPTTLRQMARWCSRNPGLAIGQPQSKRGRRRAREMELRSNTG